MDARRDWADVGPDTRVGFYLAKPGGGNEQPFSRVGAERHDATLLGFRANALAEVVITDGVATATFYTVDANGAYQPVEGELAAAVAGSHAGTGVALRAGGQAGRGRHADASARSSAKASSATSSRRLAAARPR